MDIHLASRGNPSDSTARFLTIVTRRLQMKITKFLLGALLSIAGTQAFGFEGATSTSDMLQQPQPGYVTVSHNEYNAMENRILNLETKLASFENSSLAAAANGTSCTSGGCTGNGCTGN